MSRHRNLSSTLYVRNLSERVRYDDLKRLFSKYGKLVDITIPLDYHTRMPKGYCFIEYEDARDADEAMYKLQKYTLFGRDLELEFARGDRKTSNEMRNREREKRYRGGGYSRGGGGGGYDRSRSRSRDRHRRSRGRDASYSRSRSRSYSKGKRGSESPRKKSESRGRSRSYDRNDSRQESPPQQRRSAKSSENNNRSPSPADD